MPPQPNSPSGECLTAIGHPEGLTLINGLAPRRATRARLLPTPEGPAAAVPLSCDEQSNDLSSGISLSVKPPTYNYNEGVAAQVQIRVKLNRVFFPR